MTRGDDPDRTRSAGSDPWQTGNRRQRPQGAPGPDATRRVGGDRPAPRRADDDPVTRRNGPPPPDATRRVGPPPGPRPQGGPTRRFDAGPTQHLGAPPTAAYGAGRPPRPDATRMMPAPITEPELLGGRYRLEGLLGQGGMSDVHRATDTRLNRPVAVKIFGAADDPSADQRFEQEAQVMANLRHPGLVAVHDFAVESDRAYLVMELVDGPTLKDVVAREDLPPEDIRRIGTEVAQTLAYVHSQGVTHRDVKPSNILIDADGRARLADFGIAALLGADGHTAAGEIIGTPAYLSPEQVQGREVGPPTDVYALGLVLLEAWTGRQEYQGQGLQGAAERVHRSPVVPADVPEPLRTTITQATATDPGRRPDARRVAEMLAEPTAVAPPPVEPEPEQRDLGSSGAGKWIAIGALVVALLVLLLGFLLFGGDDSGTRAPATTETSAPATTETTEAPTGENGGGITIPSNIPGIPTELPSLPSNLPSIPTELPSLPSNLPDPGQIGQDAQGFWQTIQNWWEGLTGN
ncbi:serine/threonine-protein kinase [Pseudonocardia spirodelae]|uniref:non-specific serine/threonine protein kinase n=1 Tax=Pseudonocardia spirodelae TaxID=3133431 RepID=A0ABU8T4M5_9PSEU